MNRQVEAPSTKIQDPDKLQIPSSNNTVRVQPMRAVSWMLKFGAFLDLGVWILELSAGLFMVVMRVDKGTPGLSMFARGLLTLPAP